MFSEWDSAVNGHLEKCPSVGGMFELRRRNLKETHQSAMRAA